MRVKAVGRQNAAVYLKRHEACFSSMQLLADDPVSYGDAVALLAVHSAISLADAITVACKGLHGSEDHRESWTLLKQLCRERRVPDDGLAQYGRLLANKTAISYGAKPLDIESDVKPAQKQAERFTAWALKHFEEVRQCQ
jgi:hypothetical protein